MKIYRFVQRLLENEPELRDSDKRLIWAVWTEMGLTYTSDTITRESFMNAPSEETITRARRKAQELHPELSASRPVRRLRTKKKLSKGTFIFREGL